MGTSISRAHYLPSSSRVSAQTESIGPAMAEKKKEEKNEKVDYMNLPCPVPYCLLQDEAWRILELPHQEGMGITLVNKLNERFFLKHKITMESMFYNRMYAFSAVFHDPKLVLDGEIDTDGIWTADVKYNLTNNSFSRMISKMTNEQRVHSTFWFYYKASMFLKCLLL
ncbi:putative mitochondrial import receptor subunit TOM40-2 [Carex rostrata]